MTTTSRGGLSVDVAASFGDADEFAIDVQFDVNPGETVTVLGPSGSGKTLLLETIAGFHDHEGAVSLGGIDLTGRPPEHRDFGLLFQEYALFPHLTAEENVAFGTRYVDDPADPTALLADLGVADVREQYPATLSGGEKQRVALARALAVDPAVLLLDEPLSALDVPTRRALRRDLEEVLAGTTAILVTHDRTTARALGDVIVVMHDGEVRQVGPPGAVFDRPANPFVARFTGSNCLPVGAIPALRAGLESESGDGTRVAIRPEAMELVDPDSQSAVATARVEHVTPVEGTARVELVLVDGTTDGGSASRLRAYAADPPAVGSTVGVSISPEAVSLC